MICYPNAKINLGLRVTSKREDGFHNIDSFFLPIPLFDILEVKKDLSSSKGNHISYSGIKLTNPKEDLIVKAYNILNEDFTLPNVRIHIHKNIPICAGLGGGSSDAAYMLMMLNNLCNLKLGSLELMIYANRLGSDCSFFLINTFSHVMGRGDKIFPQTSPIKNYYFVIIKPKLSCSTAHIFSHIKMNNKLVLFHPNKKNIQHWRKKLVNELESVVFDSHPELNHIKNYLYKSGATYASMTGSGSAIYGLFKNKPHNIKYKDALIFLSALS